MYNPTGKAEESSDLEKLDQDLLRPGSESPSVGNTFVVSAGRIRLFNGSLSFLSKESPELEIPRVWKAFDLIDNETIKLGTKDLELGSPVGKCFLLVS